jgi:hypothetical protein
MVNTGRLIQQTHHRSEQILPAAGIGGSGGGAHRYYFGDGPQSSKKRPGMDTPFGYWMTYQIINGHSGKSPTQKHINEFALS